MFELPIEDLNWIRNLKSQIWEKKLHFYTMCGRNESSYFDEQKRKATPQEWIRLFRLALKYQLPCTMRDNMSELTIYNHHDVPIRMQPEERVNKMFSGLRR